MHYSSLQPFLPVQSKTRSPLSSRFKFLTCLPASGLWAQALPFRGAEAVSQGAGPSPPGISMHTVTPVPRNTVVRWQGARETLGISEHLSPTSAHFGALDTPGKGATCPRDDTLGGSLRGLLLSSPAVHTPHCWHPRPACVFESLDLAEKSLPGRCVRCPLLPSSALPVCSEGRVSPTRPGW